MRKSYRVFEKAAAQGMKMLVANLDAIRASGK